MKLMINKRLVAVLLIALGTSVYLASCGDDNASNPDYSYAGPGSTWSATIRGDGTFTLTETDATPDLVINGTYTSLASGYLKMTVSTATGPSGQTPSAGDQAYAIQIPGVVLLVKPLGDNQIIPMVASGSCPSADQGLNWVQIDKDAGIATDSYGTYQYTHATTSATLPAKYNVAGSALGAGTVGTVSCSAGVGTVSGGTMYMTASGGAIVHTTGGSGSVIMAMPNTSSVTLAGLAGDYAGVVFDDDDSPVKATVSSTGIVVTGQNPDTGADDTTTIPATTLDGWTANSPSTGFLSGQFAAATTEKIVCMAQANVGGSGKNFIFCIGDDPNPADGIFNLLLISK